MATDLGEFCSVCSYQRSARLTMLGPVSPREPQIQQIPPEVVGPLDNRVNDRLRQGPRSHDHQKEQYRQWGAAPLVTLLLLTSGPHDRVCPMEHVGRRETDSARAEGKPEDESRESGLRIMCWVSRLSSSPFFYTNRRPLRFGSNRLPHTEVSRYSTPALKNSLAAPKGATVCTLSGGVLVIPPSMNHQALESRFDDPHMA